MRVFVVVNHVRDIIHRQTTALLIASLVRSGCEVHLANVDAFAFEGNQKQSLFQVRSLKLDPRSSCDSTTIESIVNSPFSIEPCKILDGDMILIRTNPGRDQSRSNVHDSFLGFCRSAMFAGIRVVNDPTNLHFFASKASLSVLDPKYRPPMMVSHHAKDVVWFVRESKRNCVIKPIYGSRGQDVIQVTHDQDDLHDLIESTFGGCEIVAQHFVDSSQPGDQRIIVVDGKILESGDHVAGITRIPAKGDFRANLHTGGTAQPVELSATARLAVEHAAKLLNEHGIWLAGVDLIGDKIIEFNVFSTGGFYDSIKFSGVQFDDILVERLSIPSTN